MLVRYHRSGGYEPADDELLEIDADGSFTLRRVVSPERIGDFAGKLPASQLSALEKRIAELREQPDAKPGLPPQVSEQISAGGVELVLDRNAKLSKNGGPLVTRLRELCEDLRAHPVAALSLGINSAGDEATLESVGPEPLTATFDDAQIEYSLFNAKEEFVDSGSNTVSPPDSTSLAPGWKLTLPLELGTRFDAAMTLQATFDCAIRYADGRTRPARLSATAGRGWKS